MNNTFPSPFNQRPIELGAEFDAESLTKYINDYGDLTVAAVFALKYDGDIIERGKIIAGAHLDNSLDFSESETIILNSYADEKD